MSEKSLLDVEELRQYREVRKAVMKFYKQSAKMEYTDTDVVWQLLDALIDIGKGHTGDLK